MIFRNGRKPGIAPGFHAEWRYFFSFFFFDFLNPTLPALGS